MANMTTMQEEIAYRFAATAVPNVSLADATEIVQTFLLSMASCQACNNTGMSKIAGEAKPRRCLMCDTGPGEMPRGDPTYARWTCRHRESHSHCQSVVQGDIDSEVDHSGCGPSVTIPLPLDAFRQGVNALEPGVWKARPSSG